MGQLAYFAKSPVGIFAFLENGELAYFRFFSKNPEKAVDEFIASSQNDAKIDYELVEDSKGYMMLRNNFREFALSLGFAQDDSELNAFLSGFGAALSQKLLAGSVGKDRLLVQAMNASEDLGKAINLFEERIYEWFSLHYPELRNRKDLVEKIVSFGSRKNFPGFKQSTGIDLDESDENILKQFANLVQEAEVKKETIDDYVRGMILSIAPSTSSLVGPVLAARLIALAGSLEKLARMPASTIQLLGAEKALFRHLHNKGKSPKYGIIYTSSLIQEASRENKGKVARLLSAQLMKAARIDFYSGRFEPRLKEELDTELRKV